METYWLLGHPAIGQVQGQGAQQMVNSQVAKHEANVGHSGAGAAENGTNNVGGLL
jgi:hypothetical protein